MSDKKEIVLQDNTVKMSGIVSKVFTVEPDGTVVFRDDAFEKSLKGTGITMDDVINVQNHVADFVAGTGLAVGMGSITAMDSDPKLEMTTGQVAIGMDRLALQFERGGNVIDNDSGAVTTHGRLSASYTVGAAAEKPEFNNVRARLVQMAQEVLG
jgi:hypothetical protein